MANEAHLARLKQGVKVWNAWRNKNPRILPDLSGADLSRANFSGVDLYNADLSAANLSGANLSGANFSGVNFSQANLHNADLRGAFLCGANFSETNLSRADLSGADVSETNLSRADFVFANLSRADLHAAQLYLTDLSWANLSGADLSWAAIIGTRFAAVDLSTVWGLENVYHLGRSTIGIDTLYLSKGRIHWLFLRGAGVPDEMITYINSLVGHPFEFYSCFISYSSKDQEFAKRLYADLQSKGVRCWFAPEDLKIGEKFRTSIDEAIRVRDKLLLVLSTHSVTSEWVETEVETAFAEERRRKKTILFPIRIDNSLIETHQAWAAHIFRTRHIGDFQQWKDHDAYQQALNRLLNDLQADS